MTGKYLSRVLGLRINLLFLEESQSPFEDLDDHC